MQNAMVSRLVIAAVGVAALWSPSPAAQQQAAPPTFRSGVDLITIDVTVVEGDGRQVPVLGVQDFAVEVDGKPRAVLGAQYIEGSGPIVPGSSSAAAGGRADTAAGPDGSANQIVFAIDVGTTSPESRDQVLAAANAILDRLPPADRVAVAAIPLRLSEIAFTTNRPVARTALQNLTGWSPRLGRQLPFGIIEALEMDRRDPLWERAVARSCDRGDEFVRDACRSNLESEARALVSEAASRTATSTTGLQALLRVLARIEGPKTLLYFSEELATDGARVEVARVARAAAAARTRIHVLQPQPATSDAASAFIRFEPVKERQRQIEGLEYVSDWTGGDLFTLGANNELATRLVSELSGRYVLMVETATGDRDGRPHAIRVRVPDRRVTVRARREFVADNLRTFSAPPTMEAPAREPATSRPSPEPVPSAGPAAAPITAAGPPESAPVPDPAAATGPAPDAEVGMSRRGATFAVMIDPLHPDRKSDETVDLARALAMSLATRGFAPADSAAEAAIRVELSGQRVLGAGRTALPSQARSGSPQTVLVRATVTAGNRVAEIRGRNQTERDVVKSATDETARLIDRWLAEDESGAAFRASEATAEPPASVTPPQELLPHMRAYVGEYEKALAGIVAEERYVQIYSERIKPYPAPPRLTRRELRSEMGFAWFPTPGTWFGFRDVLEADGKPVADRQQRLEQLFVDRRFPSGEQLSRVAASSSRFNIGPAQRNFNVPTLALLVASPSNLGRFAFELRGYEVVDGVRVALIAFSETGTPTLITRDGRDWPSRGLLRLEPETGRIWRTDLLLSDHDIEMRQTTWFRPDERLNLMVPVRMRELYDYVQRSDEYVEAIADYSNVRRFLVNTFGGDSRP